MRNTFFFGNGLNYLSDNPVGWEDLLETVMGDEKFDTNSLPYLMTYERIRLNWNKNMRNNKNGISHLKIEIANILKSQNSNQYYKELLKLPVDNYLTTNYDYAINKAFQELSAQNLSKTNSTEELYSIRRNTSLVNESGKSGTVWNIHGELNNPKSIMLGINHYCGSVGKIDGYLKGTYNFTLNGEKPKVLPIEQKLKKKRFDGYSWLELFFNSNVHIAGFGLDFSEIDLWWVLNKRARLIEKSMVSNSVTYYAKPLNQVTKNIDLEKRKRELLKSFEVDVISIPIINGNYGEQWKEIFNQIRTST
jgi:hypothetical protein